MAAPGSPEKPTALQEPATRLNRSWPNLDKAARRATAERERLGAAMAAKRLIPEDASFVVFGSLARGEWTAGSDVDWALLVDGPADAGHLTMTHDIRREIDAGGWAR